MQQLEGFQYVTALDLNIGYYTISLYPAIQDMMNMVTEFGKFGYNRFSMGIWDLGYIFQAKVEEIIGDIEGVSMDCEWYFTIWIT